MSSDPLGMVLLCPPLKRRDDRPQRILDVVEQQLRVRLDWIVGDKQPRRVEDRRSLISDTLRTPPMSLPIFFNSQEGPEHVSLTNFTFDTGPDRALQLWVGLQFPARTVSEVVKTLIAAIGTIGDAWWGHASPGSLTAVVKDQFPKVLDDAPPPFGLPRLTQTQDLDSLARPHLLGWINYWSDGAARLAGFDSRRDVDVTGDIRRLDAGAWLVQLTDDPLEPERPEHISRLVAAYGRFKGVGRVPLE